MNKRILAASLVLLTTASVAQAATYTVTGFGKGPSLPDPFPYGDIATTGFFNDRGQVVGGGQPVGKWESQAGSRHAPWGWPVPKSLWHK